MKTLESVAARQAGIQWQKGAITKSAGAASKVETRCYVSCCHVSAVDIQHATDTYKHIGETNSVQLGSHSEPSNKKWTVRGEGTRDALIPLPLFPASHVGGAGGARV